MDIPTYDELEKQKQNSELEKQQNLITNIDNINSDDLIRQFFNSFNKSNPFTFTISESFKETYKENSNNAEYYKTSEIKEAVNDKCKFVEEFFKSKNYPYTLYSSNFSKTIKNERIFLPISKYYLYDNVTYYKLECKFRRNFF